MLKILLGVGVVIVAFQIATPVYSINYKLLDLEADSCTSKIWTGIPIPRNKIKESLDFLYETDVVDTRYSQASNFKKFYEKITSQVKDQKFLQFAEDCRLLQEESNDTTTKIAVHLLLEMITKKYTKDLEKAEKLKLLKDQKNINDLDKSNILNIFLNADKNIEIK